MSSNARLAKKLKPNGFVFAAMVLGEYQFLTCDKVFLVRLLNQC